MSEPHSSKSGLCFPNNGALQIQ